MHRDVGVAATGRGMVRRRYAQLRTNVGAHRLAWLIALCCVLLSTVLLWPVLKLHLQAIALFKMVSGDPLSAPLRAVMEPYREETLLLQTAAGPVKARLYTPVRHPHAPGLVVFHGIHYLGMNEPRLMGFARAMSACGLQVLTPELPDIKDYRVSEGSIAVIGESAKWFAERQGRPVAVMGLSFSGGLSLVAAANPDFRPSMKLVFAVGSQGSMGRVASYYRTGQAVRPDGSIELLPAHEYGPLVLEYEHVEEFVPRTDVNAIRGVLRTHLYEDKAAEVSAMQALSPRQQAEAAELMDANSDAVRTMLKTSELRHRKELAGLSPEAELGKLTVPVYLLHGEADNIIPAAEMLWIASELRATTLKAGLVSPVLSHIDMQKAPSVWDEWKLVHFMASVLQSAKR